MIEIMKVAAMEAIENSKPCDLRFGTVVSVAPLKVQISSDLTLPESLLIVPQYLTDYTVDTNLGMASTTGGGSTGGSSINVSVVGETLVFSSSMYNVEPVVEDDVTDTESPEPTDERSVTIYNALQVGDKVALIRNQGAKQFYILDRI